MSSRRTFVTALGVTWFLSSTEALSQTKALKSALSKPFENLGRKPEQAPFGGAVSPNINNYNRVSPYIANAGLLQNNGLEQAKSLGFKLIIDLRGNDEDGVAEEERRADEIGIPYHRIPIVTGAPNWELVKEFKGIIENPKNYPVLVHCVTSNRSGAIWALYRASVGVPPTIAIEEGRAAGLESREGAVRNILNIPAT